MLAFALCALGAGDGRQPIVTTDLLKIRRVTEVAVAPDGSFAVYGVQSIQSDPPAGSNPDPVYHYRTHLFRVDLNDPSAKPVQLTFGERNDAGLALSPDGRALALLRMDAPPANPAPDAAKPHPQVWLLPLKDAGEAHAVTKLEFGASAVKWRPDGKALLVTTEIPVSKLEGRPYFDLERPARDWFDYDQAKKGPGDKDSKIDASPDGDRKAIRNWLERNASRDNPTEITRLNFLAELGLEGEMTIAELVAVDLEHENLATQLTKDFHDHRSASFSPDGASIVYASEPDVRTHPDRLWRSSLWVMNADGSGARVVLDGQQTSYENARFTRDGRSLIVLTQEVDQPTYRQTKLARYDLDSKKLTFLAPQWESSVGSARLASDDSVLFTSEWHGGAPLERAALDGGAAAALTQGPAGVGAFDEGGGKIVAALITVADPNELYLIGKNGAMRRLTDLNSAWLANKIISVPEERWITRPDGTRIEYWVMNPANPQAGRKYPWVLELHGGPQTMWGPGEFSMWHEFQLLCSWGYGVVYPNQRGSSGYGYQFQHANYKDWGDGPAGDALAALEDGIRSNPLADSTRLFISGGSYAGYLTAWIIGHDHRFKAAVAQRGVYDLATFYGEGNAFRLVEADFGGLPWEPETRKLLDHESPFTYVAAIDTPFLIIHGSNDMRTGFAQSEMLYKALKQMGKPVEYIRYPNIGHELTRSGPPGQRMDHTLRIVEFFERYSGNDRAAPQEAK